MKTIYLNILSAFLCMFVLSSCQLYIGPPTKLLTKGIAVPHGNHAAAIEMASRDPFSGSRNEALADIATRTNLSVEEQLYLLAVVKRLKGFSSDTSEVLANLARNSSATPEARTEIVAVSDRLGLFSSDREKIQSALLETH